MTTLNGKTEKRSFFSIYKPGQGMYVRWGTVAGFAIFILTGAYWLANSVLAIEDIQVKAGAVVAWIAVLGFLTFWATNTPKFAEFLIMTESEMRKVTWPTRREVIVSTKVVIIMTFFLAIMLWLVDIGFMKLFQALKIL